MIQKYEYWVGFANFPAGTLDVDRLIQILAKINIKEINSSTLHCQLFNPVFYLSKEQLSRILSHVSRTFNLKTNISNQPSVEFLLYLGIERQIGKALNTVGLTSLKNNKSLNSLGLIIFGESAFSPKSIDTFLSEFQSFGLKFEEKTEMLSTVKLIEFQSCIKISDQSLWRIIKCNAEYITNSQLHSISEIAHLPRSLILSALEDAANERMIKMYVDNNKR